AADGDAVWVLDGASRRLARVDPRYGTVVDTVRLERVAQPSADRFDHDPASVAAGAGAVWITDGSTPLVRVDRETVTVDGAVDAGRRLNGVAAGAGDVWAISG